MIFILEKTPRLNRTSFKYIDHFPYYCIDNCSLIDAYLNNFLFAMSVNDKKTIKEGMFCNSQCWLLEF